MIVLSVLTNCNIIKSSLQKRKGIIYVNNNMLYTYPRIRITNARRASPGI